MPKTHSTPTARRRTTPAADPLAAPRAKDTPKGQMSPKPRSATKQQSSDEVLPAPLSKQELRPMINKARRYGRAFKRNGQLLAIELRRLQDAGAHQTYGRASFGAWATTEFADLDLSAENAKKLSQAGRALLVLQRNGKIDLDDARTFPGPTGARALSSVLAKHGEDAMLQIFDAVPADSVVANTVKAAAGALLPPAPATAAPPAGGQSSFEDDDDDEEPEEIPKLVQELRDYIERLRDYLDDLAIADDADPIVIVRQYEHFVNDAQALRPVLDAVLPAEDLAEDPR